MLGFVAGAFHITDWRLLLWIGVIPPLVIAPFAFLIIPDDRCTIPYGAEEEQRAPSKFPIKELFAPALRGRTLRIVLMIGLNFFAYQAFAGWQTTYLQDVRGISSALAKEMVWQFGATIIGGFAWGWFADRFGRKANALGFLVAAAAITLYLTVADSVFQLSVLGIMFGLMLPASVIWGPWLAELYPVHLRSTAASIFNWGRLISLSSPPITAAVAENFGLGTAMGMAAASFTVSALVWRTLPETLERRTGLLPVWRTPR